MTTSPPFSLAIRCNSYLCVSTQARWSELKPVLDSADVPGGYNRPVRWWSMTVSVSPQILGPETGFAFLVPATTFDGGPHVSLRLPRRGICTLVTFLS